MSSSKNVVHIMIKRSCEENKIVLEETLSGSFFNVEKVKEGKQSFKLAVLKILEIAEKELDSWTRRVPNVRFVEPSGIVVFGLKDTAEALSFLVKDINFWILNFVNALPSEHDWHVNGEVIESLRKMLGDAIDELSVDNAIRNKISEENKKTILKVLEVQKDPFQFISPPKSSKLSLKKSIKRKKLNNEED